MADLPLGDYENVSLVIDNIFGSVMDWLEAGAAGVGTALACTVGEVATLSADTTVCVAGVVGTAGLVGSSINDTVDAAHAN